MVAPPVAVNPLSRRPPSIHVKCSGQFCVRGLNNTVISLVSGSVPWVARALLWLQFGQERQRLSRLSLPSGSI